MKCSKELYCNFLISAQTNFAASNLARCLEETSHDSITRWLGKTKLTPKIIWEYTEPLVEKQDGYLILDDAVLDKSYSRKIEIAQWQYSGTRHEVVMGIGLVNLLWTKGGEHIPVDFRIYAKKKDGKTKNDHFREMLRIAQHRGFKPQAVLFDSWYASLENLILLRKLGWNWITTLQKNRTVSTAPKTYRQVSELDIPENGLIVHLKAYGKVKVFKIVRKKEDVDYYTTNNLDANLSDIREAAATRWKVEEYHRGLKQTCGLEKCQARSERSQRTHIFCSILSFIFLEIQRLNEGISWYQTKRIVENYAVKSYLEQPLIAFNFVGDG